MAKMKPPAIPEQPIPVVPDDALRRLFAACAGKDFEAPPGYGDDHASEGEYTSTACIDACTRLGLRRSMSRTGSCLDNAVAESFFATLKVELVDRHHYCTRAEARAWIFGWIAWYNRYRLHSTNGSHPPIEWEQQHSTINPLPSTSAA